MTVRGGPTLISHAVLAAAALVCAAVPVVSFYPGLMNADTLALYAAALLAPPVPDWHSPFLAYVWRGLIELGVPPAALAASQSGIWFLSLGAVLAIRRVALLPSLLVLVGVLAFPPVLPWLATIEKTVFMAVMLGGCFATTLALERTPPGGRRLALRAAMVAMALAGVWARPNGALLFLPLAAFAAWRWRRAGARRGAALGGLALFALIAIGTPLLGRAAGLIAPAHPEQPIYDLDLFNLTLATGEDLMPPGLLTEPLAGIVARLHEEPWTSLGLGSLSDLPLYPSLVYTPDGPPIVALRQAWLHAVLAHPLAYLRYRWAYALAFNCVDPAVACPFGWHWHNGGIDPNPFGFRPHPVQAVFAAWRPLADTWVFRPIVLAGLVLGTLMAALWRRRWAAAATAGALLVLHAGNLVLTASPDPRLSSPLALLLPLLLVDVAAGAVATTRDPRLSSRPLPSLH